MRSLDETIEAYGQRVCAAADLTEALDIEGISGVTWWRKPWTLTYDAQNRPTVFLHETRRQALCHFYPGGQGLVNRAHRQAATEPYAKGLELMLRVACTDGLAVTRGSHVVLVRHQDFVPCIAELRTALWIAVLSFQWEAWGADPGLYARAHNRPLAGAKEWWEAKCLLRDVWSNRGDSLHWALKHTAPRDVLADLIALAQVAPGTTPDTILAGTGPRPW